MKRKKIAILGASEPHLPLYLKAKEMGLETYCFAWKAGAYCKDYADHYYDVSIVAKEEIARICQEQQMNGIISNALELAVPTVAYVSEVLGLNGIPYSVALITRNKFKMREKVANHKACLQPHSVVYKPTYVPMSYPVIVKPVDGSCSNGVTKVDKKEDFEKALRRAYEVASDGCVLVEEYIEGKEISVETISFHGIHYVLTITDKETTGSPFFVEVAHHQPSMLPTYIQEKIKIATKNILDAIGINNGASHAEFKIDQKGNVFFIEVGARGGGDFISYDLVELSTGYDYVRGMIEVALGNFHVPTFSLQKYSGVYFLSKEVAYIRNFIEKNRKAEWAVKSYIKEGPLQELRKSQDRSGYIVYQTEQRISIAEELKKYI